MNKPNITTKNLMHVRFRDALYSYALVSMLLFMVLTVWAMIVYPGGTKSDPQTLGYSFWNNFFSDLGRYRTFLGGAKEMSLLLFSAALLMVGSAFSIFFSLLPAHFTEKPAQWSSIAGSLAGVISGVSYIVVALTPWDLYLHVHIVAVKTAFTSFTAAVFFYIIAIFADRHYPTLYGYVYAVFAVAQVLYLVLLFFGPTIDSAEGVLIQATGQKIIVYVSMMCMMVQVYGLKRYIRTATLS